MSTEIKSPMPGKIIEVVKKVGDSVALHEKILTMEAMKMEMPVVSTVAGSILELPVEAGKAVAKDALLAVIG